MSHYYRRMDDLYKDLKIPRKEIAILYNRSFLDDYNSLERAVDAMAEVHYDPYKKPKARSLDGISTETKSKLWLLVQYSKSCHCKASHSMSSESKLASIDPEGENGFRVYFNKWMSWRNESIEADELKIDLI
jgi:hypothetical protein